MKYEVVIKTKDIWNAGTDCTAWVQLHSNSLESVAVRIGSWIYRGEEDKLIIEADFNGEPITDVTLSLQCSVSDNEWDPEYVTVTDPVTNISYRADYSHAILNSKNQVVKVTTTIYEENHNPSVDDETVTLFKDYMKKLHEKLGNNFTDPKLVGQALLDLIMDDNTTTQKRAVDTRVKINPTFMSIGTFANVNIIGLTGWESGAIYSVKDGKIQFPSQEKGYKTWLAGWDMGIEVSMGMTIAIFDTPDINSLSEWAFSHGTSISFGEVGSVGLSLSAVWPGKGRPEKNVKASGLQLGVFLGAGVSMPVSIFETWEYTWLK